MKFSTDGIVLKASDVGDSDRVLTVLTKDYGVVRAFANGAKRLRSSKQSATQPLCYSHFTFFQSRDSFVVDDAQSIETFFRLRDSIENLSLAQYFCELECEYAPETEPAEDYLRLILNCLHMLVTGKKSRKFLKPLFELRILTLAGYMPDLGACAKCGEEPGDTAYFDISAGVVYCGKCPNPGVKISKGILNAMRRICTAPAEKLFSFELAEKSLDTLCGISERYLLMQARHPFKALDFYNKLFF
ncbi:MAG: DNA repair protein RecO [Clostridia bacterium]|nr:DNA repair protein RecO [Clostridia bacterium]MBQ4244797.1 DNA repair protein RecO [Clostridia bacterium]